MQAIVQTKAQGLSSMDPKKFTVSYANVAEIYHESKIFKKGAAEIDGGPV